MNQAKIKFIYVATLMIATSAVWMTAKMGPVLAQSDVKISQSSRYNEFVEAEIDAYADRIFFERHPELAGSKIRPGETNLAREWQQIRQCEAVVDYFFYQRHPELAGRKIQGHETALVREWNRIYSRIEACQ